MGVDEARGRPEGHVALCGRERFRIFCALRRPAWRRRRHHHLQPRSLRSHEPRLRKPRRPFLPRDDPASACIRMPRRPTPGDRWATSSRVYHTFSGATNAAREASRPRNEPPSGVEGGGPTMNATRAGDAHADLDGRPARLLPLALALGIRRWWRDVRAGPDPGRQLAGCSSRPISPPTCSCSGISVGSLGSLCFVSALLALPGRRLLGFRHPPPARSSRDDHPTSRCSSCRSRLGARSFYGWADRGLVQGSPRR